VADLVVEAGLMTREAVEAELSPSKLSGLHITQSIPVITMQGEPHE
jgi:aspartate ammonia-lyase